MQTTVLAVSDVVRRGKEIYESRLRAVLEPEHVGEYLAIDVETGEHVLARTDEELTRALFERGDNPNRYLMRIGQATLYKRGGMRIRQVG